MAGEENIISAVIHVDSISTPHCIAILAPLTKRGTYRRKTIGDKEMRRDAREIFEAMQESGASRQPLHV